MSVTRQEWLERAADMLKELRRKNTFGGAALKVNEGGRVAPISELLAYRIDEILEGLEEIDETK